MGIDRESDLAKQLRAQAETKGYGGSNAPYPSTIVKFMPEIGIHSIISV